MAQPEGETSGSLWEEYDSIDVVDVVVDSDAPDLQATYSYSVPDGLSTEIEPGRCVHVVFSGRQTSGYVIARRRMKASDPLCSRLRDVSAIVTGAVSMSVAQIAIAKWMSARYVCSVLDAVRCIVPAALGGSVTVRVRLADSSIRGTDLADSIPQAHVIETLRTMGSAAVLAELRVRANIPQFAAAYAALIKKGAVIEESAVPRANTRVRTVAAYRLGPAAGVLQASSRSRRSPQMDRVLQLLVSQASAGRCEVPAEELMRSAEVSASSLKTLLQHGLIERTEQALRRAPVTAGAVRTVAPLLTAEQGAAAAYLHASVTRGVFEKILLFGVTASGKTEVYLDAIAHTLAQGRSAVVLVPEIALTAQVADVFVARFGDLVAVLHSRLSEGERYDEWRRMQNGEARIVVGARSAIFAPMQEIGLIIVDEEHEASYKQESTPRYNALEVAEYRARGSGAVMLLGSATPSIESYKASDAGRSESPIIRLEMQRRINNRPLPRVRVVDLREEYKHRKSMFSQRLTEAIAERLKNQQQTILFLNRRGYAQFILCRDCGYVAKCPNCAISLAFHAYDRSLRCHHCDYSGRVPQVCPDCQGEKVRAFGIGTEKVEEEVLSLFPAARVSRMDRDTTSTKGAHARIVRGFKAGAADILIGTQMVAKGLDFPNVTLVGVISADTSINMPDFRAAERTFQLLTQVAGRSGRGAIPGEVIIQTFTPDHFAVLAAVRQDYRAFYEKEIAFRQELKYPPFSRLANLVCQDESETEAQARADRLADAVRAASPETVEVIGPSPAPIPRLRGLYRFHVALRAPHGTRLHVIAREALATLSKTDRYSTVVDIDPLNMA